MYKKDILIRDEYIKNNYDINKSQKENLIYIKKEFPELSHLGIQNSLKRIGIKTKNFRGCKPSVLENPFKLGDPIGEYWLGVLLSDGNVSDKNCISISSKEDYILDIINYIPNIKKHISKKNNQILMFFSNEKIAKELLEIGITPRKSLTLDIKFNLTWNIFRGVFDGDGSLRSRKGFEMKITTGSLKFANKIVEFLKNEGFNSVITKKYHLKFSDNPCYDVHLCNFGNTNEERNLNRLKLYNNMYNNAKYFLKRKQQLFLSKIKELPN